MGRYPDGVIEDTAQQTNYYYDANPFDGTYENAVGRMAAVRHDARRGWLYRVKCGMNTR